MRWARAFCHCTRRTRARPRAASQVWSPVVGQQLELEVRAQHQWDHRAPPTTQPLAHACSFVHDLQQQEPQPGSISPHALATSWLKALARLWQLWGQGAK